MIQRIDLYQAELRPPEASGLLSRYLAVIGLAAFLMIAWGGFQHWQAASSAATLATLAAEQTRLQDESERAAATVAARAPDAALTVALIEAQLAVTGRRWMLEQLQQIGPDAVSFAAILEGLGRQRPEPLWLTRIRIRGDGAVLGLAGQMQDPEAVALLLQRLTVEPALHGVAFSHFRIDRLETGAGRFGFVMATACPGLPEDCAGSDQPGAGP